MSRFCPVEAVEPGLGFSLKHRDSDRKRCKGQATFSRGMLLYENKQDPDKADGNGDGNELHIGEEVVGGKTVWCRTHVLETRGHG